MISLFRVICKLLLHEIKNLNKYDFFHYKKLLKVTSNDSYSIN